MVSMQRELTLLIQARDKASDDLRRLNREIDGMEQRVQKAGINWQGFAVKAGIATAAVGGAIFATKNFIDVAREQQNALATLEQVTSNTGFSFASYEQRILSTTASLQEATNFGDEFQQRVLARMIPILGDVDQALAALPAVLDAATVSGNNAMSVANTLTKALAGQAQMAESVGLKFDTTAGFNERLAQTMAAVGGAARANADPFVQLGNDVGDLKEEIGSLLIGPATEIVGWLRAFTRETTEATSALADLISHVDEISAGNAALLDGVEDTSDQIAILEQHMVDVTQEIRNLTAAQEQALAEGNASKWGRLQTEIRDLDTNLADLNDRHADLIKTQKDQGEALDAMGASWLELPPGIQRTEEFMKLYWEAANQANERTNALRESLQKLADQPAPEITTALNIDPAAIAAAQEALDLIAVQREVALDARERNRQAIDAEAAALLKEAEAQEKAKEAALAQAGELRLLTFELQEAAHWEEQITQVTKMAEEGTLNWAQAEEVLKALIPNVTDQIREQQVQAKALALEFKRIAAAAQEAAAAQAQFAGIGPTGLPVTEGFVMPHAAQIFQSLSSAQVQSLQRNFGIDSVSQLAAHLRGSVQGFLPSSLDRAQALLRAIQQLEASLPGFDTGGVVPGPIGQPRLIMAHAGETVLPTHRSGGSALGISVSNNFAGATILGIDDLDETIRASVRDEWRRLNTGRGGTG